MEISLSRGRDFYDEGTVDPGVVLVNEEAVKLLSVPDPPGLRIKGIKKGRGVEVVGVVKDFHFRSIHEKVAPLFIIQANAGSSYTNTLIRVDGDLQRSVDAIGNAWKKFNPDEPFIYSFLDDDLQSIPGRTSHRNTVPGIWSDRYHNGLPGPLCCIGLYG